jgi:PAS domain S-box-containing protein
MAIRNDEVRRVHWAIHIIIWASAIADLLMTDYFLSNKWPNHYQNVYFITAVLAAYFYRNKGVIFTIALSAIYFLIYATHVTGMDSIINALIRVAMLVAIAIIVAYLANGLDRERSRYQSIFRMSDSGQVMLDRKDRRVKEANPRFSEMVGGEKTKGAGMDSFFCPVDAERLGEVAKDGSELARAEMRVNCLEGRERTCLVTGSPISADEYLISAVDVTEMKGVQSQLEEAGRKLSLLNSITRHDILNQTLVLSGTIDLMLNRPLDPYLESGLQRMKRASDNISRQISFTRDYQDLGAKAAQWFNIGRSFQEAFDQLRPPGVRPVNEGDQAEILADPLFTKVFYNLIDNTMRHGANATEIRVSCAEQVDRLVIVYEDNGGGISAADREHLFVSGYGKNTGLGLFLTREILGITSITIEEKGTPGNGARFEIVVPKRGYRRTA